MQLPVSFFINSISQKDIFYFSSTLLHTSEPHYFICIKKGINDVLLFCVSSTQKDKILQRIKVSGFRSETMVHIKPNAEDSESPFPDNSYIDCNHVFPYTTQDFKKMYEDGRIKVINQLPVKYFEEIINGVCLSDNVDLEIIESLNNPIA